MKVIFNSIKFILLTFIIFSITVYIIQPNHTFVALLDVFRYSYIEVFGLVLLISQLFYILFVKDIDKSHLVLNIFICSILYLLSINIVSDENIIYFTQHNFEPLFIERSFELDQAFSIYNLSIIKNFLSDIHGWDLNKNDYSTIIVLLLFNITIHYLFKIRFNNQIILRLLIQFIILLFILYIWSSHINMGLFILNIIILSGIKPKNESN